MNRFMVLYQSTAAAQGLSAAAAMADASPEQMEAGMALWRQWHEKCGDAIVDLGAPLGEPVTVDADSVSPATSLVSGYTILQSDSQEEAIRLMEGHPHFHAPGASIMILEAVRMPPM